MFIYKITNTYNEKIYIGKTQRGVHERWMRHVNDAKTGRLDTYFARAIRKYGAEAFMVEAIDEAISPEELSEKEKYWIDFYHSDKAGYNMTSGGDGNNTYGRKSSSEMDVIKNKIRQTKLGDKNPQSRKYKCRNIITGEELHFNTAKECMLYFGEKNHNFVTRRALHKISYLFRGEWQISYEEEEYNSNYTTCQRSRKGHEVRVIDMITSQIMDFYCYAEAERFLEVPRKYLSEKADLHGNSPWIKDHYIIQVKSKTDESVSTIPDECMGVGLEIGASAVIGNEAAENRSGRLS